VEGWYPRITLDIAGDVDVVVTPPTRRGGLAATSGIGAVDILINLPAGIVGSEGARRNL
jgi:hypothetical protein